MRQVQVDYLYAPVSQPFARTLHPKRHENGPILAE